MPTNSFHTRCPASCRKIVTLRPGEPGYPPGASLWDTWNEPAVLFPTAESIAGPPLAAVGHMDILSRPSIGLLCSVRCPGSLILMTYEFAKKTPHDGAAVIGGFHSPMERTCLDTLLARHVPVICCPGRRLNERGIPRAWDAALAEGRLLVLSPFVESQRHVTRSLARQRNSFVAALANVLFVPYAVSGGYTEAVVRSCLHRGKPVCTFRDEENHHLGALGARAIGLDELLALAAPKTTPG